MMTEKLHTARRGFAGYFGYYPEFPPLVHFDQEAYAAELDKCVKDNFDYTIEKYGTIPPRSFELPDIIID